MLDHTEDNMGGLIRVNSGLTVFEGDLIKRGLEFIQDLDVEEDVTTESNSTMYRIALDCYNRGLSKYNQGLYQLAQEDFTQAISLDRTFVHAYFNRACISQYLGNYSEAISDYSEVIRLQPSFYYAYVSRGYTRSFMKDYSGSIADYTQAILFNSNDAYIYLNRGLNYYYVGDRTAAFADYNRAIEINPYLTEAWFNRGFEKGYLGDSIGAIADYTKAIELNPHFASAYYQRSIEYNKLGNFAAATADYNYAIRLDPSLSPDYTQISEQISTNQNQLPQIPKIKVIAVGDMVSNIAGKSTWNLPQAEVWAVDINAENLDLVNTPNRLLIGQENLRGLGFGQPNLGQRAAEESRDKISAALGGSDLVVITATTGDNMATGAVPIIAVTAKKAGALTIGILAQSAGENSGKQEIKFFQNKFDLLIIMPKLKSLTDGGDHHDFSNIWGDEIIDQCVQGLVNLLTVPGLVLVDFSEVKSLISAGGVARMTMGRGQGKNRAVLAANAAVLSLENVLKRGQSLIVVVIGDRLSLNEINLAASTVYEAANHYAKIVYGGVIDENLTGEIRVVVIAIGV